MARLMQAILMAAAVLGQVAIPTPRDAAGWAIAHSIEQPADQRPLYRYVWIPPYAVPQSSRHQWDERHVAAAISYAINEAASQTAVIIRPAPIANGWMVAVYLPDYASATKLSPDTSGRTELQSLIDTWDKVATEEPYFHVLETTSGQRRVAVAADHLGPDRATLAAQLGGNPAIVYRVDWMLTRLLHRNYYGFAQFANTQTRVYGSLGIDEARSQQLDGDQRIAIMTSSVTGKPRRVDRLQGVAGRHGTGAVWQTWDVFDESVAIEQHPLYNLLRFVPDGGEAIFERPNGLHGYLLYGADRVLVTEAPPELVSDHTIPAPPDGPGTRRLAPAISCIRCHGASDGLQTAANDVRQLLDSGTDILADLAGTDQRDVLHRLAGLYAGDFSRRIKIGRDDYDLAVRRATQMPGVASGMGVSETSAIVSAIYGDYAYRRVDAAQACRELGHDPGQDPLRTLAKILPPATPENVVIASLRAGIPVRRGDWEQVYSAAMSRQTTRDPKLLGYPLP